MNHPIDTAVDAALGLVPESTPEASVASAHHLFDEMLRQQRAVLALQEEMLRKQTSQAQSQLTGMLTTIQQVGEQSLEIYRRKLDAKIRAMERLGLVDLSLETDEEG